MKSLVLAALLAAVAAPALAQSSAPAAAPATSTTSSTTSTTTTTPAPAGQSSARAAVGVACAADFKAQCPGKTGPDMQSCVRDNFDKMSEGCQGAIMTMMSQGGGGER